MCVCQCHHERKALKVMYPAVWLVSSRKGIMEYVSNSCLLVREKESNNMYLSVLLVCYRKGIKDYASVGIISV